jgi:NADPH-dependent ferric siderophore reductase
MLTFPAALDVARDSRAPYRPYTASVARIVELSPGFRRVTFVSSDFRFFATHGLDQRIKLMFPIPGADASDLGADDDRCMMTGGWFEKWRALPDARRSPIRTFTVRAIRPDLNELDVDFQWHGDGGPAAHWLATASIGDDIVIVGPDARSESSTVGIDWRPGSARELLLVGDGTSAPAICSIVESLPEGVRARAFILVPTTADAQDVVARADAEITWMTDDIDGAMRTWAGRTLDAVPQDAGADPRPLSGDDDTMPWGSPASAAGQVYAWVAGESAMVKRVRRLLVNELGLDRSSVAFMGYWRRGASEGQT